MRHPQLLFSASEHRLLQQHADEQQSDRLKVKQTQDTKETERKTLEEHAKKMLKKFEELQQGNKLWIDEVIAQEAKAKGGPLLSNMKKIHVIVDQLLRSDLSSENLKKNVDSAQNEIDVFDKILKSHWNEAAFYKAQKLLDRFDEEEWAKRILHAKKDGMFKDLAQLVFEAEYDLRTKFIAARKDPKNFLASRQATELGDTMDAFIKHKPPLPEGVAEIKETSWPFLLRVHAVSGSFDAPSDFIQLQLDIDGTKMMLPPDDPQAPFLAKWSRMESAMSEQKIGLRKEPKAIKVSALGMDGMKYGPQDVRLEAKGKKLEIKLSNAGKIVGDCTVILSLSES